MNELCPPHPVPRCRLHRGQSHVEVEWTVGPIPFKDGLGREVVLQVRQWLAGSLVADWMGSRAWQCQSTTVNTTL